MKIISNEEKQAHMAHIAAEGAKGLVYGGIVSTAAFFFARKRWPQKINAWNTSVKACSIVIPTIGAGAFWADQGSWEFDKEMHHSEYTQTKVVEEFKEWNRLSSSDKVFTVLNDNKYKIIISAWAASLYGSWVLVNRDKIMTTAQKAVQARMYAQGITVILLLSTILLAMKEEEINKAKPKEIPEWRKVLMQKEEEEKSILAEVERKLAEKKAEKTEAKDITKDEKTSQ